MKKVETPANIIDFTDYVSAKYYLLHKDKEEVLSILKTTEKTFNENDYFYQTLLYNIFLIDINFMDNKSSSEIYQFAKQFISEKLINETFNLIIDMNDYNSYEEYFRAVKNSVLLNPAFLTFNDYFTKANEFIYIDNVGEMVYKDDKYLYYGFEIVKDKKKNIIIPKHLRDFKWLKGTFFSDGEFLYSFYGKRYYFDYLTKIEKCDINTLEVIGEYYSRDKERIFYTNGKCLISKSSMKLKLVDDSWESYVAKDEDNVYFKGIKIKEANALTYKSLGYSYYSDNINLWYENNLVKGKVDLKTFVPISNGLGTDKKYVYLFSKQKIPTENERHHCRSFFENNREKYKDYWY